MPDTSHSFGTEYRKRGDIRGIVRNRVAVKDDRQMRVVRHQAIGSEHQMPGLFDHIVSNHGLVRRRVGRTERRRVERIPFIQ